MKYVLLLAALVPPFLGSCGLNSKIPTAGEQLFQLGESGGMIGAAGQIPAARE